MTGRDVAEKYDVDLRTVYDWAIKNGIEHDNELPGTPYIFRVTDIDRFEKEVIPKSKLESIRTGKYYRLADVKKFCRRKGVKYSRLSAILTRKNVSKIDVSNRQDQTKRVYRFDITEPELDEFVEKNKGFIFFKSVKSRLVDALNKKGIEFKQSHYRALVRECGSVKFADPAEIDKKIDEIARIGVYFCSQDQTLLRIRNLRKIIEEGLIDLPINVYRLRYGYLGFTNRNKMANSIFPKKAHSALGKEDILKILDNLEHRLSGN